VTDSASAEGSPLPADGFALFAKGFRPFFLGASLLGAALVLAWLGILFGGLSFSGRSFPLWHGHEMLYGFALAVVAGFLLTAVGNWTGRETATGAPLAGLVALWALGRLGAWIGPGPWLLPAQVAELAFLPVLGFVLGRRIVAARNWRNAGFLVLLTGLWLCDVVYTFGPSPSEALARAVDLVVVMIVIMSGRVVPMFTRNGIGDPSVSSWPRMDAAALFAVVATAVAAAGPRGPTLVAFEAASAVLVAARMIPWKTHRTFQTPLVWVLHLGHAWIAVGFALRALHHATGIGLESLGLHAHTAGAIGVMTLGMMARVALGHTGRPLVPPPGISLAFGLIGLAALVRVLPGLVWLDAYRTSLLVSGLLFSAAQLLYLAAYAPMLWRARIDGRPG
jgi:uncharacterized protein involved in response to NO